MRLPHHFIPRSDIRKELPCFTRDATFLLNQVGFLIFNLFIPQGLHRISKTRFDRLVANSHHGDEQRQER